MRFKVSQSLLLLGSALLMFGCGASGGNRVPIVALTDQPDSLDPAIAISLDAQSLLAAAYLPLLTYRRGAVASSHLIPALVRALPTVDRGGRRYRMRLRSGLRYSNGAAVRASDFRAVVERILRMPSPGVPLLEEIAGAKTFASHRARTVVGISTSNSSGQITIWLSKPDAAFANHLATTYTAMVAPSTPARDQSAHPPAGIGPYVIRPRDSRRVIDLVANPYAPTIPGLPPTASGHIRVETIANQELQVAQVLRGQLDLLVDPPTPGGLALARREAGNRVRTFPTYSTYYFFLNSSIAPFNSLRVRQAASYAVDPRALARLYGGLLTPSCSYVPRGIAGFDPKCRHDAGSMSQNRRRARQLLRRAGALGDSVTIWSGDSAVEKSAGDYLADALEHIGLRSRRTTIASAIYPQTVGNSSTKAQAGTSNWFPDFPAAQNFTVPVAGNPHQSSESLNFGQIRDRQLDRLISLAHDEQDRGRSRALFARIEQRLLRQAYLIPYGSRQLVKLAGRRIDFGRLRTSPVYGVDLTSVKLR